MERVADLDMQLISTRWRDEKDQTYVHNRGRDQEYLNRLVESIRQFGYFPGHRIIVYDNKSTIDLYQLVDGLLRFRAAKIAGFTRIPALIIEESLSEKQLFTLLYESGTGQHAFQEIDRFMAVRKLFKAEFSRNEIVDRIGIPLCHVDIYLWLDRLPENIIDLWFEQKQSGEMKPFKVTSSAIEKLYRAMMKDRRNGNFDPNGGPEYKTVLNKLNRH